MLPRGQLSTPHTDTLDSTRTKRDTSDDKRGNEERDATVVHDRRRGSDEAKNNASEPVQKVQ